MPFVALITVVMLVTHSTNVLRPHRGGRGTLKGRYVVSPLAKRPRLRRGGSGVVDGGGRLRRPRPVPLPHSSISALDFTHRFAPPHSRATDQAVQFDAQHTIISKG